MHVMYMYRKKLGAWPSAAERNSRWEQKVVFGFYDYTVDRTGWTVTMTRGMLARHGG